MKPNQPPSIIVLGASAGGVTALQAVVAALPAGLDAAIFVALHLWAEAESLLPHILSRAGKLPASHPADGAYFETGRIYVAPPDRHLLLNDSRMTVVRGPKENRHRPSIDVLFRSAATTYRSRVIGVLLTGSDDDGAAGLKDIQECGGITVVQDPDESAHREMPESALRILAPHFTLPLDQIGPAICNLVEGKIHVSRRPPMLEPVDKTRGQEEGGPVDEKLYGTPSPFSCPDCNGTLWEVEDGQMLRYRCRVGHAYSARSMVEAESEAVERAMWAAVRVLEESVSMSRRIAQKSEVLRPNLLSKAAEREEHARILRNLLVREPAS